jgi:hypothetical protein
VGTALLDAGVDAVSVELDLVQPIRPARRLGAQRGELGLDEIG